uniref:Uncharacterized protein n=1 Tax=Anguilla anguilla TaxID=7936 RepID=A0A0E9RG67_ANGAN
MLQCTAWLLSTTLTIVLGACAVLRYILPSSITPTDDV